MNKSKIEWCDYTWNPVTGCEHNCPYCYAERIAMRFKGKAFPNGFNPSFYAERLREPMKLRTPSKIFAVSMGDLFGDWVPNEWISEVFKICKEAPQHQYIFLTKNPKKFGLINGLWYNYDCKWPENAWLGTSITNQVDAKRILKLPYGGANTFVSIEPLLESVDLSFYLPEKDTRYKCSYCGHHTNYLSNHCQHCNKDGGYSGSFRKKPINWIIVGAQTGPGAKQPKPEWVEAIINQARKRDIPIFLKDSLNWPEKIQEFPLKMEGKGA